MNFLMFSHSHSDSIFSTLLMKTFQKLLFIGLLFSVPLSVNAQQWQFTGSLSSAKRFVIFTTLDNGKVLASGGVTNDLPHAECELYDPATASWSLTGSHNVARYLHSAVKLKDGRVAIFGGQSGGTLDDSPINTDVIEIYDPSTGVWSVSGHLQIPREHQSASLLLDGRVLIAGGLSGDSPVASAEIFDPTTDVSTLVAPMQQARYEQQAASLLDGRVMITGGRIGGWDGTFFNESEIYDPVANTWTVIEPMKQPRMRGLLVQFSDGSILSAGGRNAALSTAPGSELFDLSTGHWTETDSMKVPSTWLSCVLFPDDRYLATGGFSAFGIPSVSVDSCTPTAEWYDKPNARWYFAPTLNQARGEHGSAYLHQEVNDSLPADMVIVGGGITGDNTYTATCEILDVGTHALLTYEAMSANSSNSASVNVPNVADHVSIRYDENNLPLIDYAISSSEPVSVRVISLDGRTLKNYDLGTLSSGSYEFAVSNSQLNSGAYIVLVELGNFRSVQKIIISH